MTPAEILEALDDDSLDPAAFHHEDHIAASWLALQDRAPVKRICGGIQRLSARAGKANRFDEKLTRRWLRLIDSRRRPGQSFEEFKAANADLFDKSLSKRALEDAQFARVRRLPLMLLRVCIAAVLGGLSLHEIVRGHSYLIASIEVAGALLLPFKARAGAAILGATMIAATVVHRGAPISFVVPACALVLVASEK